MLNCLNSSPLLTQAPRRGPWSAEKVLTPHELASHFRSLSQSEHALGGVVGCGQGNQLGTGGT